MSPWKRAPQTPPFSLVGVHPGMGSGCAARATLDQLSRGRSTVSATLALGDLRLRGQSRVTLAGFRPGVDGEWIAKRVVQMLNNSGYSTSVETEIPTD